MPRAAALKYLVPPTGSAAQLGRTALTDGGAAQVLAARLYHASTGRSGAVSAAPPHHAAVVVCVELQKEAPVACPGLQSCRLRASVARWVAAIDSVAYELALEFHVILDGLWVTEEMVSRRFVGLDESAECIAGSKPQVDWSAS